MCAIYIYTLVYTLCAYLWRYAYTHIHMHTHAYTCMHMYTHVYTYIHIHNIHIHMYTYTQYTYTHIYRIYIHMIWYVMLASRAQCQALLGLKKKEKTPHQTTISESDRPRLDWTAVFPSPIPVCSRHRSRRRQVLHISVAKLRSTGPRRAPPAVDSLLVPAKRARHLRDQRLGRRPGEVKKTCKRIALSYQANTSSGW